MSSSGDETDRVLFELCAGGIDDVLLAARCGVDRIELNSGMAVGGLTPSAGLAAAARRFFAGPIIAMVRPREGGFAYSDAEFRQMIEDAESLLAAGADGLALGFLTPRATVDISRCKVFRQLFAPATLVFHRAFDVTHNLEHSLAQLIDCGFDRILTSGGEPAALDGASVIRNLRRRAREQIEIIPGGGIRAHNVVSVLKQTECRQFHSAARETVPDASISHGTKVHFGIADTGSGSFARASEIHVTQLVQALQEVQTSGAQES